MTWFGCPHEVCIYALGGPLPCNWAHQLGLDQSYDMWGTTVK